MKLNYNGLPIEKDLYPVVSSEEATNAYLIKLRIIPDVANIPCPQCGSKVSLKQKKVNLTRFFCSNAK